MEEGSQSGATRQKSKTAADVMKPAAESVRSATEAVVSAWEYPKFEMPKMEVPPAFREFAEKSVSQCRENYERMKSAAEEATDVLEDTYASVSKGASDYGLKLIEAARINTNSAFDFATELMAVKSVSEMVELSTAHTRKHFEAVTAQTKELAALAQRVATETAEPIKGSVNKAFKKVA